ncbi:hypothetical protein Pcinc_037778 [Petrolisthes cinctipes]|uniref:Uncharacterized protein n=1 Tax=Petrolisthes cinctipes TaxID=88211 RepID=A0AAE1EM90_PETCI|nr:hypothetical protein Pcinc_037778 [Petrolisthes cinctipes]
MGVCTSIEGQPRCLLARVFCLSLRSAAIIVAAIDLMFFLGYISYSTYRVTQEEYIFAAGMMIGDIIEGFTHLAVAVILAVGLYKERRQLLRAWIWTRSVVLVTDVSTLFVASTVHIGLSDEEDGSTSGAVTQLIVCLTIIPFYVFFIVVVRSYALELKAKDNLSPTTGAATIIRDADGNEVLG